ncbi:MAG: DUF4191 domain-containing protein [Actinomycetaceae bacterium]|nr:DUF4191 domain-containing protein [Actinomycetaceae bacterium]
MSTQTPAPKRSFWQNLKDGYTLTKRSFPQIGWWLATVGVGVVAIFVIIGILTGKWIMYPIFGISLAMLAMTAMLSTLINRAMYRQLEGHAGATSAVLRQVKRGWDVEEQPVAVTRNQDMIFRLVGRPGIVLLSEGPASRVSRMLDEESKKLGRIAGGVPVHKIQVGTGDGQVPLRKVLRHINKLKKAISRDEVPVVANRLRSIQAKTAGMPRAIDPAKVKLNRRILRGK